MLQFLEWDSNFFQLGAARLDASKLAPDEMVVELQSLKDSDYQLIYIFSPHGVESINKEIIGSGGKLVDQKVTFSMNISGFIPQYSPKIRSCLGFEMDKDLEMLAIESGKYSRFKVDEQIPRNKFEDLYRLWMKNSLLGVFAKEVFVFEDDGKKTGMVSVDIRGGEGWIGIIAVDEKSRGKQIGKHLMHAAIQYFMEQNVGILNVQTQLDNSVSCAFYEKIGFRIRNIEDVYHFWNKEGVSKS